MSTVKVLKPIIKDNLVQGYSPKTVTRSIAKRQLSLPNEERNSHWKNVKLAEGESLEGKVEKVDPIELGALQEEYEELYGKKPHPKTSIEKLKEKIEEKK